MMIWAAIAVGSALAGIVQVVTGFGAVVVMMAILPFFFGIVDAPTVALAINMIYITVLLWKYRKHVDMKVALLPTVIYCAVAVAALRLMGGVDTRVLAISFAVLLMVLSVYFLVFSQKIRVRPGKTLAVLCGTVAGITGGLFGVGGPPMVLYFLAAAKDRQTYMGSLQFLFVVTTIVTLLARFSGGMFRAELLPYIAVGTVGIMLGMWLGEKISSKMNAKATRVAAYLFVGISGLTLLLQQI